MPVNRRDFLRTVAGGAASAATLSSCSSDVASSLPDPSASHIDHIVVVMMENRSFDHFLGWLPGANGQQAGLTYASTARVNLTQPPASPPSSAHLPSRPRPHLRGRPQQGQQWQHGRVVAHQHQRHLRHWLLHRGRPALLQCPRA